MHHVGCCFCRFEMNRVVVIISFSLSFLLCFIPFAIRLHIIHRVLHHIHHSWGARMTAYNTTYAYSYSFAGEKRRRRRKRQKTDYLSLERYEKFLFLPLYSCPQKYCELLKCPALFWSNSKNCPSHSCFTIKQESTQQEKRRILFEFNNEKKKKQLKNMSNGKWENR